VPLQVLTNALQAFTCRGREGTRFKDILGIYAGHIGAMLASTIGLGLLAIMSGLHSGPSSRLPVYVFVQLLELAQSLLFRKLHKSLKVRGPLVPYFKLVHQVVVSPLLNSLSIFQPWII